MIIGKLRMSGDIGDVNITGVEVDDETRCAHYHGEHDIIACKSKCCAAR